MTLLKLPSIEGHSQRKLSTFQSGQYCLAVNETLLSAFRGQHCPNWKECSQFCTLPNTHFKIQRETAGERKMKIFQSPRPQTWTFPLTNKLAKNVKKFFYLFLKNMRKTWQIPSKTCKKNLQFININLKKNLDKTKKNEFRKKRENPFLHFWKTGIGKRNPW